MEEFVLIVRPDGSIEVGPGYNIGQVLTALDVARKAILDVVLRPATPPAKEE